MSKIVILATLLCVSISETKAETSANTQIYVTTFTIQANYDLSVDSLVVQGKYDWKSNLINDKNFQTSKKGNSALILEIINFNLDMSSEEVLKELDVNGLRPAELHELLAFGIKYPDGQRECPIVALGSVWKFANGTRGVPVLWGDNIERRLSLAGFDSGWGSDACFAAVSE